VKKKILKIIQSKNNVPLVCLTAYSKPFAKILDKYCDIVLVGDSLATAMYGMKNTHEVTIEMMIQHGISVKQNLNKALCVIDMPKDSYKTTKQAIKNARLIFKKTKCDAVKLECNGKNYEIIKNIVKKGMPVMGHIGFTPQYHKKFKPQGDSINEKKKLLDQAKKIQEAGSFSLVLECVNKNTAKIITKSLKIPTIGIGASSHCDGQVLVTDDLIGLNVINPRFLKRYLNLKKIINNAVIKFKMDVKNKKFPKKKHSY